MKSITIHGLDDDLDRRIRSIATQEGLSLNKAIKKILRRALGLDASEKRARRDDFQDLLGVWSESDLRQFQKETSSFSEVNPADWQ